jgi:hypothetical protein
MEKLEQVDTLFGGRGLKSILTIEKGKKTTQ